MDSQESRYSRLRSLWPSVNMDKRLDSYVSKCVLFVSSRMNSHKVRNNFTGQTWSLSILPGVERTYNMTTARLKSHSIYDTWMPVNDKRAICTSVYLFRRLLHVTLCTKHVLVSANYMKKSYFCYSVSYVQFSHLKGSAYICSANFHIFIDLFHIKKIYVYT